MIISFFEEFPTPENMRKVKQLPFPTKLYIAAPTLQEFERIKQQYSKNNENNNIIEWVYWPILSKKEGYWLSPFSNRTALQRIFQELTKSTPNSKNIPLMLDLELPTTRNPLLYLTESWRFWLNRQLISNFIPNYKGKIYLCEYYPEGKIKDKILHWLGLHYPLQHKNIFIIKMLYHSIHQFQEQFVHQELQRGRKEWGDNFILGLGTIATGINGNEPLLSPTQLHTDLTIARQESISEVIVFRLGGLRKEYVKIVKKFV